MNEHLQETLKRIGEEFRSDIDEGSRFYVEVDIGERADKLGFADVREKFGKTFVIVPLKRPRAGMKVRIDGRSFVNYALFDSGIAAPGYVAKASKLPYRRFVPNDSMIKNFT
jgi:hypothetical protein